MKKIKIWIKRYLPAEIFATATAVLGGYMANNIVHNDVVVAFVATWGENIGYYGVIIVSDFKKSLLEHKTNQTKYGMASIVKDIRNIILEFGPAETLDSFIVRPFTIYLGTAITGNILLGVVIGKIAADVIFYIPTIIIHELLKKNKSK